MPRRASSLTVAAREARVSLSWLADAHHPERQKLALFLAHRHVLADFERMITEPETFLLYVVLPSPLPLEGPGRAADAACMMHEKAAQRRLVTPEAVGEAFTSVLLPGPEIDVAIAGEGSDEIVAVPDGAFREFLRAGGVQRDLAQRGVNWRGHRPSSLFSRLVRAVERQVLISCRLGEFARREACSGLARRQTRSIASAAPWPTPTHIVARP